MIHAVIDRKDRQTRSAQTSPRDGGTSGAPGKIDTVTATDPGLGDLPRLKEIERRLPPAALARLFVDPRSIERSLAAAAPPKDAGDARIAATLRRYLAAVDYAGAALVLSKSAIVVHTVETLDPSRLDPWLAPGPAMPGAPIRPSAAFRPPPWPSPLSTSTPWHCTRRCANRGWR